MTSTRAVAFAQDAATEPNSFARAEMSPALADVTVDSAAFRELADALTAAYETRVRATADLAQLVPAKAQLETRV